jgi:hypothetical protein
MALGRLNQMGTTFAPGALSFKLNHNLTRTSNGLKATRNLADYVAYSGSQRFPQCIVVMYSHVCN